MRNIIYLTLLATMGAEAVELDVAVTSRSVSEPMAIEGFTNEWDGDLHKGDIAWTRNRLDIGVRQGAWRIGYTQRYDYTLKFNNETADLYYRSENDLPEPAGDVPVRLDAWHMRAQGVKLSWQWTSGGFFVEPAVSLLSGWQFQDGSLNGFLRNENGDLSGQAELDYRYSQDLLLDHQFDRPSGKGLVIDLLLGWEGEQKGANLEIQDLYGRMWWRDAPYTRGTFNTVSRNNPGVVRLDPAFSGVRDIDDYQQRLSTYILGDYWQDQGDWRWSVDAEYFLDRLWVRPGVSLPKVPGNPYLGHELRDGQWLLGTSDDDQRWYAQLGSDSWDYSQARSLTVQLGVRHRW
jgi:hypothetical protein